MTEKMSGTWFETGTAHVIFEQTFPVRSLSIAIFSLVAPNAIDVPFKITVLKYFCKNELLKGGNGAGIKSQVPIKCFYEIFGKNHVSNTQRGRNRFGKGIEIDDVIVV